MALETEMQWKKARKTPSGQDGGEELETFLAPVVQGLGLSLIELNLTRHRGSVQVRLVVFKKEGVGVGDCSAVHRAVEARLQLRFPEADIFIEVSSPGIDRLIRDGVEFMHYIGSAVKCYVTEDAVWRCGILERVTESYVEIKGNDGMKTLNYETIAKAKLDSKAGQ